MLILLEVPPLDSEADAVGPLAHSCLIIPKGARIFRAEAVPPGCLHLTPFAFHSIRTSRWIVIYCPDSPAPSLAKNSPQVISAGNEVGSVLGHGKGLEAWLPCMVSSSFASVLSGLCLGALPVRERGLVHRRARMLLQGAFPKWDPGPGPEPQAWLCTCS